MKTTRRNFLKKTATVTIPLASALTGCLNKQTESKDTIKDLSNRTINLPNQREKIIALGAGSLRLITHMRAQDQIIGVEEFEKNEGKRHQPYIKANPELIQEPSIGPQNGGDPELILKKDPDLIFYYGTNQDINTLQQKTNTPVISLNYVDIGPQRNLLYSSWKTIGEALKKQDRAQELIDYTEDTIKDFKQRTQDIEEPKKAYVGGISYKGSHGIRSTKTPFPPFTYLNIESITQKMGYEKVHSPLISREKILQTDPAYLFLDETNLDLIKQDFKNNPEYESIKAYEENNIYGILPYSYYHRNISTILINTYFIGKTVYPNKFSDIDIEEKANEIYQEYVGEPILEEMKETYSGYQKIPRSELV